VTTFMESHVCDLLCVTKEQAEALCSTISIQRAYTLRAATSALHLSYVK